MQNKTLKTIALFGDEAVINQQKKMREARLMAEGNYLPYTLDYKALLYYKTLLSKFNYKTHLKLRMIYKRPSPI